MKHVPSKSAISRRKFLAGGATLSADLVLSQFAKAEGLFGGGYGSSAKLPALTERTFSTPRHTTHYWEAGPKDGPLMIFLHGWPEIALMWRAQMEAFASEGWRCIAPDMRGYGGSSAPAGSEAYATKEIVGDMVELHDHLGAHPAIWVGHDWGSPVAGSLAAHHPARSHGVVLISVPYFPDGFALPSVVPLIDRQLYPADKYPDGQWDYYRFYLTHFDQSVSDMEADIQATLASIYRRGNPASVGKFSPSALLTANGGRYGATHRAPATAADPTLWPPADFNALVGTFHATGFRPCNAWYLNDTANIAYAHTAPDGGALRQPVLFVNGEYDSISNINLSSVGDPMRRTCQSLYVTDQPAGHWLPLERKTELTQSIHSWLKTVGLH
jgi:pimeloyl-ACP methyl ester carboxylesterase